MSIVDSVMKHGGEWMERWQSLVIHPKRTLRVGLSPPPSGLVFFLGSQFGAYIGTVGIALVYFSLEHRSAITAAVRTRFASFTGVVTATFGLYVIWNLIALLLTAVLTFGLYRAVGGKGNWTQHVDVFFHLSFLDPFVTWIITLTVFIWSSAPVSYDVTAVDRRDTVGVIVLQATYAISRVWYLISAEPAVRELHSLSRSRGRVMYGVVFVPAYLLLCGMLVGIGWMVSTLLVIGGD